MIEAEFMDELVQGYKKCLADTETFLNRRQDWPLDSLIELSTLLRRMESHLFELRAHFPSDARLTLLVARCETNHEEVIALADAAAKWEREFSGASIH